MSTCTGPTTCRCRPGAADGDGRNRRAALPELARTAGDRRRGADRPASKSAVRLQQLCGAATAKSMEDCLFYRDARLVSLNEVGGEPDRFGVSVAEFHQRAATRSRLWPHAMVALSTHDTKRGEDVRARIGVLSQVPSLWAELVGKWVSGGSATRSRDRTLPAAEHLRRVACRRRGDRRTAAAAARVRREGDQGGRRPYVVERSRRHVRNRSARVAGHRHGRTGRDRAHVPGHPVGRARAKRLPRPEAGGVDGARRARCVSGHRTVG